MKKILLAIVAFTFCIISAQAESVQQPIDTAAYITQSLTKEVPVLHILAQLMNNGANLQDAVSAVISAGGNKQKTVSAALIINPDFTFNDPTLSLSPTAAGKGESNNANKLASSSKTGDPKHLAAITLGFGGGASPF